MVLEICRCTASTDTRPKMHAQHARLHDLAAQRILLLDGAMGSMIHRFEPTEADYRGERFRDHPIDLKNASGLRCARSKC